MCQGEKLGSGIQHFVCSFSSAVQITGERFTANHVHHVPSDLNPPHLPTLTPGFDLAATGSVSATKLMTGVTSRAACDAEEAFANVGNSPLGPAGGLDHRRHAVSVQALGLGEVDHVEDDSLEEEAEETRRNV